MSNPCQNGYADPEEFCESFHANPEGVCPQCGFSIWEDDDYDGYIEDEY